MLDEIRYSAGKLIIPLPHSEVKVENTHLNPAERKIYDAILILIHPAVAGQLGNDLRAIEVQISP